MMFTRLLYGTLYSATVTRASPIGATPFGSSLSSDKNQRMRDFAILVNDELPVWNAEENDRDRHSAEGRKGDACTGVLAWLMFHR